VVSVVASQALRACSCRVPEPVGKTFLFADWCAPRWRRRGASRSRRAV